VLHDKQKRLLQLHKMYDDVKGKNHYGRSIYVVHNEDTTFNKQIDCKWICNNISLLYEQERT